MYIRLTQNFIISSHIAMVGVKPWECYNLSAWAPGRKMKIHRHDVFQAIQVLEGRLEVDYGAGWVELNRGSVHVLPPGCWHRLKSPSGYRQFGLDFTIGVDEMGLLDTIRRLFPAPTVLPMCFLKAWEEKLAKDFTSMSCAKLRQLFVLLDWTISLIETRDESPGNENAMRLANLLKTWNCRSISVEDVARQICCSRAKAQRICKKRFGCGIAHLHEKIRMEETARLLLNTGMSVGEIADKCGFSDIYGFTRAFKRVMGKPPSAFRNDIKGG